MNDSPADASVPRIGDSIFSVFEILIRKRASIVLQISAYLRDTLQPTGREVGFFSWEELRFPVAC